MTVMLEIPGDIAAILRRAPDEAFDVLRAAFPDESLLNGSVDSDGSVEDGSDLAPISDEDIEAVRAGVADNLEGRHSPLEDVVARLRAKYPRPAPADTAA